MTINFYFFENTSAPVQHDGTGDIYTLKSEPFFEDLESGLQQEMLNQMTIL